MAQYQHLQIYKTTYELLIRVMEITQGFPRDFKSFATSIREDLMEIIVLIYRVNSTRNGRKELLETILERMQVIELSLRLSKDLQFISVKQFSSVVELTESVIRQASGWHRSAPVSAE